MFSVGIVVSPVEYAAFFVPFVFAIKFDGVACFEGVDAGGKINIVGNEEGLTGTELEDKFLMSAAVVIIGQNFINFAGTLNLEIARTILVSVGEGLIAGGADGCCVGRCATGGACLCCAARDGGVWGGATG